MKYIMPLLLTALLMLPSCETWSNIVSPPPDIQLAPYRITAGGVSRNTIYYAEKAWREVGDVYFMENYYRLKDGKWLFVEGQERIPFWGGIKVEKR